MRIDLAVASLALGWPRGLLTCPASSRGGWSGHRLRLRSRCSHGTAVEAVVIITNSSTRQVAEDRVRGEVGDAINALADAMVSLRDLVGSASSRRRSVRSPT